MSEPDEIDRLYGALQLTQVALDDSLKRQRALMRADPLVQEEVDAAIRRTDRCWDDWISASKDYMDAVGRRYGR